eukprot:2362326-Pyramimonas_sp.AAC.1
MTTHSTCYDPYAAPVTVSRSDSQESYAVRCYSPTYKRGFSPGGTCSGTYEQAVVACARLS